MFTEIGILIYICLIVLLLVQSYGSYALKKEITQLKEQLLKNKTSQEEFSLQLTQMNTNNKQDIDPLTNLLGRKGFENILNQLINQSERFKKSFALLMLKINNFDEFSQTHSVDIAEKLLIDLAKRIKPSVRQVDTVARYADNMFLLLLPNLSTPETAVYIAQRLLDHVALPILIDEQKFTVTASIGITIYPYDATEPTTLLKYAEEALNKSRSSGNNLFQFYQEEIQVLGKRELGLKSLVISNDFIDKLSLNYLSYINTATNEEICIETDVWLQHPEFGKVLFPQIYHLINNAGRMTEIYEHIITTSVNHFKTLEKLPKGPKQLLIPFNLKEIQSAEFMERVFTMLESLDVAPEKFIFELIDNFEEVDTINLRFSLDKLKEKGFQIAIGVLILGHFALKKITNLPIHYLKIDNQLIKDIDVHLESQNILERLLMIANKLEMGVLTQGVEKQSQVNLLQNMGCYIMQGSIIKSHMVV